jgi:hypothetical protein
MTRIVPVGVLLILSACLAFGQEAAVTNTKDSHMNSAMNKRSSDFTGSMLTLSSLIISQCSSGFGLMTTSAFEFVGFTSHRC